MRTVSPRFCCEDSLLAEKRELDELAVILCVGILFLYLEIIMTISLCCMNVMLTLGFIFECTNKLLFVGSFYLKM